MKNHLKSRNSASAVDSADINRWSSKLYGTLPVAEKLVVAADVSILSFI